jgi:hypothetical protein
MPIIMPMSSLKRSKIESKEKCYASEENGKEAKAKFHTTDKLKNARIITYEIM